MVGGGVGTRVQERRLRSGGQAPARVLPADPSAATYAAAASNCSPATLPGPPAGPTPAGKQMQRMVVKPESVMVRPFAVCAVLRGVQFDPVRYNSFIDLQVSSTGAAQGHHGTACAMLLDAAVGRSVAGCHFGTACARF